MSSRCHRYCREGGNRYPRLMRPNMTATILVGVLMMLVFAADGDSRGAEVASGAVPGLTGSGTRAGSDPATLTEVAQVRRLTPVEAARRLPVSVRGVVTFAHLGDEGGYGLFVQDASAGIFVSDRGPEKVPCRAGDLVEVEGVSDPGLYAPLIEMKRMRVVGKGPMPEPWKVSGDELMTGRMDSQRVRVRGTITRLTAGPRTVRMGMLAGEALVDVTIPAESGVVNADQWVDAEVWLTGVCGSSFNTKRQLVGVNLSVRGVEDVEVIRAAPSDPFMAPQRTIRSLFQFDPGQESRHRVRVPGVVTLRVPGLGVFLQDDQDGLFVPTHDAGPLLPGDRVEVAGFLQTRLLSSELLETRFRRIGPGAPVEPASVTMEQLMTGDYDNRLVRLDTKLLERRGAAERPTLFCRSDLWTFEVRGHTAELDERMRSVQSGTRLRLTGVWVKQRDSVSGVSPTRLLLREPGDLTVVEAPVWWNSGRTVAAAAGLIAMALAIFGWAMLLRRQVAVRTAQMRDALALLEASVEQSPSGIMIVEAPSLAVRQMNAAALAMRGTQKQPLTGLGMGREPGRWQVLRPDGSVYPADELPLIRAVRRGEVTRGEELLIRDSEGADRWVVINAAPVRRSDGSIAAGILVFHDISDRKQAEEERGRLQEQLLQAQKIESVGRLAGGVAHDFNNMLQTILGNTDLAMDEVPASSPVRENLLEIRNAAQRSADLTRQLLAFARKQAVNPRVIDLNATVSGLLKMLHRLLGEDIRLVWVPGEEVWPVRIDPSQLDQVLANLAVNARDAIRGVGRITITTSNVTLDDVATRSIPECRPGDYVQLTVRDTGVGMSEEVLSHLFEPFFTTKEVGQGTGLGLATVYGIVRQNGGSITVESVRGSGTVFTIYLPRSAGVPETGPAKRESAIRRGTETILLVEDEDVVLSYCRRVLERQGYTVLAMKDPRQALESVRSREGAVDLLITDVVMPEMNGRELRDRLREIRPGLRCLFMSGYPADALSPAGILGDGDELLQKPFTLEALSKRIAKVMGTAPAQGG